MFIKIYINFYAPKFYAVYFLGYKKGALKLTQIELNVTMQVN